jgi:Flp pilus assembly protein TadG
MFKRLHALLHDAHGGVLVEATLMMTIIFAFVLGGIDFLFAFYQFNAVAKAVEIGARIAAVWDPVDPGLTALTLAALSTNAVGDSVPAFTITCNADNSGGCTCVSGTCGTVTYNADALAAIVCGRGATRATCSAGCPASTSIYTTGMCQLYGGITMSKVTITYAQTGLGYVGRPDGPVPTITVSVQNLPFTFYFLGGVLGLANITMPPLTTSITGEYMSSTTP